MNKMPLKRTGVAGLVLVMFLMTAFPSSVFARASTTPVKGRTTKHIVAEKDVRASAASYPAERQARIEKVVRILDSEAARKQLAGWGISVDQAKTAVSRLDNSELEYLGARADEAMADLQGAGNKLWIIAGVAAAVVIALCLWLLKTTEY